MPEAETVAADLALIHDTMLCGLVVLSADWQVVRMNPAAEAILGWRLADLRGRPFRSLFGATREDGSPLPAGDGLASTALRSGDPLRNAVVGIRRRDGQRRWLQVDCV